MTRLYPCNVCDVNNCTDCVWNTDLNENCECDRINCIFEFKGSCVAEIDHNRCRYRKVNNRNETDQCE